MELNLKRQLTQFEWLQMPKEIQNLFKKWFLIPRSGGSVVINNTVISDGHTNEDLSVVSLKSLQAFLHTNDDHWDRLLKQTINKMENYIDGNEITDKIGGQVASAEPRTVSEVSGSPKAKRAYKRKAVPVS